MEEMMMTNEVVNDVVDVQDVAPVEVVDAGGNSGSGLAFGLGALAGAAVAGIAMAAPKVYHWAKGKYEVAKQKRAYAKAVKDAIEKGIANQGKVKKNDDESEEDEEEE